MRLSAQLPAVSEYRKQWAVNEVIDKHFVTHRNRNYCLECGGKFMPSDAPMVHAILNPECPDCGAKNLEQYRHYGQHNEHWTYWYVFSTWKGYQVVRVMLTYKWMKKKKKAEYLHREVMQHWIREDGEYDSLTLKSQGMGGYYDSWINSPDNRLEPRTDSRPHRWRCSITPKHVAPYPQIIDTIRRNGYTGDSMGEPAHIVFSSLLSDPKSETLLKAGQKALFAYSVRRNITPYWDSIRIALRNDYLIEDGSLWTDYIDLLSHFGKDLRNAHYVCPDDLKSAHDHYMEKKQRIERKERLQARLARIHEEQQAYEQAKEHFFDLIFTDGDLIIEPFRHVQQFYEVGDQHHHCIYTNGYYKKDHLLMFMALRSGELIETISYDLNRMRITQARGHSNKHTDDHDQILDLMKSSEQEIIQRINLTNIDQMNREEEQSLHRMVA